MRIQHPGWRSQRGITLVEAAVTTAIAAITITSAAPGFHGLIERQRLVGAAAQLSTDLHFARSEAVLRNTPLRLEVQAGVAGSCYVIHTGSAGQCRCDGAGPAACSDGARAVKTVQLPRGDGISLSANVGSVLFDPLHGTSSPTATFRLVAASGRSIEHVVNVMGRVRSCSPQGAIPGYAVC